MTHGPSSIHRNITKKCYTQDQPSEQKHDQCPCVQMTMSEKIIMRKKEVFIHSLSMVYPHSFWPAGVSKKTSFTLMTHLHLSIQSLSIHPNSFFCHMIPLITWPVWSCDFTPALHFVVWWAILSNLLGSVLLWNNKKTSFLLGALTETAYTQGATQDEILKI